MGKLIGRSTGGNAARNGDRLGMFIGRSVIGKVGGDKLSTIGKLVGTSVSNCTGFAITVGIGAAVVGVVAGVVGVIVNGMGSKSRVGATTFTGDEFPTIPIGWKVLIGTVTILFPGGKTILVGNSTGTSPTLGVVGMELFNVGVGSKAEIGMNVLSTINVGGLLVDGLADGFTTPIEGARSRGGAIGVEDWSGSGCVVSSPDSNSSSFSSRGAVTKPSTTGRTTSVSVDSSWGSIPFAFNSAASFSAIHAPNPIAMTAS
jgi:hypothetical protein